MSDFYDPAGSACCERLGPWRRPCETDRECQDCGGFYAGECVSCGFPVTASCTCPACDICSEPAGQCAGHVEVEALIESVTP